MRPTRLDDIAASVGVSAKTVSRVVNNDPRVSPATRARVMEAIAGSGYRPNQAARSLATARTHLIGLFIPPAGSHFFSELVRSAMRACRDHGYNLALEEFGFQGQRPAEIYKTGLRGRRCDGIILPPVIGDDPELLDLIEQDGVPYVRISPAVAPTRSVAINSDHAAGTRAVADYLWSLGHRRFGVIAGPPAIASAKLRRDVFIATLAAKGVSEDDIRVIGVDALVKELAGEPYSIIDLGRSAGAKFLSADTPPSAIFAYNDELAAGVVSQAHQLGIDVPRDLSVAGFDDSDAAQLCWPRLTSVRQPIGEIAARAVEMLVARSFPDRQIVSYPVELVVRESTCVTRNATLNE